MSSCLKGDIKKTQALELAWILKALPGPSYITLHMHYSPEFLFLGNPGVPGLVLLDRKKPQLLILMEHLSFTLKILNPVMGKAHFPPGRDSEGHIYACPLVCVSWTHGCGAESCHAHRLWLLQVAEGDVGHHC